jgi:hypothetical protein
MSDDARRYVVACAAGVTASMAVLTWFVARGTTSLFARQPMSAFYEAQARALFHGHWDASSAAFTFERFNIGGRFYTYFGPWPSLARMPVMLVTDRFDGRMSRVSVLLACLTLLLATCRLGWLALRLVRDDSRLRTSELVAVGGLVFVTGCGSLVVFLASWTAVYHEAIIWGAAWSVASLTCLVGHLASGSRRQLGLAGTFAAFALLSRASVGLGPMAALGLLLLVRLWQARRGVPIDRRTWVVLAACLVVPATIHAYVNTVKFANPLGVPPYEKQDLLAHWPTRVPALAANGGHLFGVKYAPTILVQYLRPDGIAFNHAFPWVAFARPAHVIGNAVFDARNPSTSVPAAAPLLFVLAVVGIVLALRRRELPSVVPFVGAAVGGVGAVSLAFIDQRYQGDFLPLLVVPAAFGLWSVVGGLARAGRLLRIAGTSLLVVAGAWSCWANVGLSYLYQRAGYPYATTADRASLVRLQLAVDHRLGAGPGHVVQGAAPGTPGPLNGLFVQGDCEQVLWSDGREWHPVETTPATGHVRLRVPRMPPAGERARLVSVADGRGTATVDAIGGGRHTVSLEYRWRPFPTTKEAPSTLRSATFAAPSGATTVDVLLDRRGRFDSGVIVSVDDRHVIDAAATLSLGPPMMGEDVEVLPARTPICNRLVAMGVARRER